MAKKSKADNDIIAEANARRARCLAFEADNVRDAKDDFQKLAGNHWPEDAVRQREIERRPCITVNKLPAFLHNVTNDQRQNKLGIKVHPVDDGSDIETAEVLQGLIRHVEYESGADAAYDTAGFHAAACGFGFFRIRTEYDREDSFDQVARFERFRSPFSVHPDPDAKEPDGSDQEYCFVDGTVARSEIARDYPGASAAVSNEIDGTDDVMLLCSEYYRVEHSPATLVRLSNGETGWKDDLIDLPIGVWIADERKSHRRKVMWYKLTTSESVDRGAVGAPGCAETFTDIIGRAEIPCRWIPVFPVYGEELEIDAKVVRSGLIRHAKGPSVMYDYWMTAATEEVTLRPKAPFIGAEGQFEGHEKKWRLANVQTFAYLEYKPKTIGGQLAPAPQRQPMADIPSGVLQMAMHAADEIKATTGLFDSSMGARGTATSGVQEREQKRQGNVANFHFSDNLTRAVRHAGRCLVDMIPRIYDTERVVRILGDDEKVSHATINKPLERPELDEKTGAVRTVLNDLTVGKYDVTVSAGASYSTRRQEASDAMVSFGQSWPKLMDVAGDKVVTAMDWPGAEEIAERIKRTIPPELLGDDGEEGGGQGQQLPPEVLQIVQQAQQHIQQLESELRDAKTGIEKARISAESSERVAQINANSKQDVEELKGWIAMLMESMRPPPSLNAAAMKTQEQQPQEPTTAQGPGQPPEYAPGQQY
jgi:hypothetical protein